ncbi:hypothetical protein AGMMS49982_14920 [Bacteroidia bacterium]|nr:hypothetical protein AGMMS49982_14920 [Bacteroidia bacterium]
MKKGSILIVDDNKNVLTALRILLENYFERVTLLTSPNQLHTLVREVSPDIVLLDMNFSSGINTGNEGLYWLSEIKKLDADLPVVLFTAYADIDLAVKALKQGASDFVVKPWDNAKLIATLQAAYSLRESRKEVKQLLEKQGVINLELNKELDIRLISATNRRLQESVQKGEFREDLLYRINTIQIEVPPLRQRVEDIPLLAEFFLKKYARKYKKENLQLSAEAGAKLQACRWSGNVRELQHTLEKAVILSENTVLQPADFYLQKSNSADLGFDNLTLEDAEKILIQNSLKRNKDNLSAVAAELGITRPTLYSKMKKYNV